MHNMYVFLSVDYQTPPETTHLRNVAKNTHKGTLWHYDEIYFSLKSSKRVISLYKASGKLIYFKLVFS